jgi:hypothetical protein
MKRLTAMAFFICLFSVFAGQVAAQNTERWIEIAPSGEYFRISMPNEPKTENQTASYGELRATGKWYTAAAALKDGRPVSMYLELQYNFNLF